jgi:hypothetical protein
LEKVKKQQKVKVLSELILQLLGHPVKFELKLNGKTILVIAEL